MKEKVIFSLVLEGKEAEAYLKVLNVLKKVASAKEINRRIYMTGFNSIVGNLFSAVKERIKSAK